MALNKKFDEQIKQKLGNLSPDFDPASWDRLSRRMDFEDQQAVDDLWKNRLGNLAAAAMPATSWDAMQQLIEADEAAEQILQESQVDDIAFEKLNNLEVPFNKQHWALMAKRIEEEFSLRHRLYRYKVAEIALMALLLLTFIRFMPLANDWFGNDPAVQEQPAVAPSGNAASMPAPVNAQSKQENEANTPIASVGHSSSSFNGGINRDATPPPANQEKFSIQSGANGYRAALSYLAVPETTVSTTGSSTLENLSERLDVEPVFAKDKQADLDKLAILETGEVSPNYSWELPITAVDPFKKPGTLRFSIFTTTGFNYVLTPPDQISVFDTLVKTDPNSTLASGYGGGVTLGFKKDKWEFQTGGVYSFKRYIPNTPIFIFETVNYYIKEDFHGIQLDLFQVPLNALYHFKNTGKWRFYASAGASAHFVTSSVYEIGYERLALNTSGPPPSSPDETKSIRQEKDFPNGLLDGGRLSDNFYMTANIGFGVERYIAPKWTLFFQPNYQHYMMTKGIGTNKDKIYTTSFYLGTKFNLK